MQSTGHSSMHALSLMSTQGSAIVYVTDVSSRSPPCTAWWAAVRSAATLRPPRTKLLVTDTRRCTYTSTSRHAPRIYAARDNGGPPRHSVRGGPPTHAGGHRDKPISEDGSVPNLAVAVGPRVHHVAQPGGHGFDAHRTGRPSPPYRSACRILRRTRARRRRADHHGWVRAQPHSRPARSTCCNARKVRRASVWARPAGGYTAR